jgi:phospholipase/lecithinase/hemolysin
MSIHSARAKFWLFSILLAFVALAPGWAAADERDDDRHGSHRPFDRIVVFGDSLSDPGNAFALNGGQTISAPDYGMTGVVNGIPEVITLIPDAPYTSRRFSDGRTWIEVLAAEIGRASSARPAVAGALFGEDDGRASNYAVGGATAADLSASGGSRFHLAAQVNLFLGDVRNRAPSDALYVIAIGGNDIRAASVLGPSVIASALTSVGRNIQTLYGAGARKFLVWNAPDLGRTPAVQRLDKFVCVPSSQKPGCVIGPATAASAAYNFGVDGNPGLDQVLAGLAATLSGITIVQFDTFHALATVQGDPKKFGLRDATHACIEPNVPQFGFPSSPPFRCAQPDRHFFWDGIHPTRGGHRVIAQLVGEVLLRELVFDD